MTANMQDVCEYRGEFYVVQRPKSGPTWLEPNPEEIREYWTALTGYHPMTGEPELGAMRDVPPGDGISTACWRGSIGHFLFEGDRLFLRALLTYAPKSGASKSDEWVVRLPGEHAWDWSAAGPFTDDMVEYTFTAPREVFFERLRLYSDWRSSDEDFVHEIGTAPVG